MTGMIRKATLLVALGLVVASAALAGVPSPANCHFNPFIDVVGTNGTVVDPYGTYTVTVHDAGDLPCPASVVTINFAAATDIRLCTDFEPVGQTNTCNIASAIADVNGVATFIIGGAAKNVSGLATGGGLGAIVVRADGYVLGNITATAFDENGANGIHPGLEGTDLSAWLADVGLYGGAGNLGYKGRSDYNHNGNIEGVDLSYFLLVSGYGTSAVGCAYCP